ncbi:MAG: hypothetical protein NXI32_08135 [bacterium]|nr:hypothetical protein [bacterium]
MPVFSGEPLEQSASQRWATCRGAILATCLLLLALGCRTKVPIHVWAPGEVAAPRDAMVALAPVAGNAEIARKIEQELLLQRPAAKADIALFTAEQLAVSSPIRLASTAALSSDLTAIKAARAVGADILLHGELLSAHLEPESDDGFQQPENVNMNQMFFQRLRKKQHKQESLLLSWRVIATRSGETLGTKIFTMRTADALKKYPDLANQYESETDLLLAASARETWTALAPVVVKDEVRLASPWLQPGAWGVRRGVKAAKQGQWELAEERWQKVVDWFPMSAAAHHNLAVAQAAREDFTAAKQQLLKARGPFAWRLPGETLFWLDRQHRNYHQAHAIPKPIEGWAFPEPVSSPAIQLAPPIDIEDLPWWTAIPFAKPPSWTWQDWLRQSILL